eukprot:6837206-Karenia_brevis.AAC.1
MERIREERSRDEEEIKLTAQLTARKPFGWNGAPKSGQTEARRGRDKARCTTQCPKTLQMEWRPQKGMRGWRVSENNGRETRKK